jgi:hypothetical protein
MLFLDLIKRLYFTLSIKKELHMYICMYKKKDQISLL